MNNDELEIDRVQVLDNILRILDDTTIINRETNNEVDEVDKRGIAEQIYYSLLNDKWRDTSIDIEEQYNIYADKFFSQTDNVYRPEG